jgi:Domain of unknown function (DUF5666)
MILNRQILGGMRSPRIVPSLLPILVGIFLLSSTFAGAWQQPQTAVPANSTVRPIGLIKSVHGNSVTLTTDAGAEVNVLLQDSTRLLRTAPGQKDLSGASAITPADLQAGDRMLVRGSNSDDGKSVLASSAIVISHSDIAQKQENDREDWKKRGVGGLVQAVSIPKADSAAGTITLSLTTLAGPKTIAIQTSQKTIVRRYAPDSVKFDDARPGTLNQIKSGDQVRARGASNADGSELVAEEIVSGTFRNMVGTVDSTNTANNTVSVMDLLKKKPVTVRLGVDSQLRKLPPFVAQRLAARLRGGVPEVGPAGSPSVRSEAPASTTQHVGLGPPPPDGSGSARHNGDGAESQGGGGIRSGTPDFQQMLSRMPLLNLADLHKGDAVMIVATEGTVSSEPTVITLLTGVDAILSATPDGLRAASILSPWNLGSSGMDAGTP